MVLNNDTRGWIMTCVSGIACVVGSSIICVDLIIQRIPSKRNFRIQDSDTFLSASLSLSFGVMVSLVHLPPQFPWLTMKVALLCTIQHAPFCQKIF